MLPADKWPEMLTLLQRFWPLLKQVFPYGLAAFFAYSFVGAAAQHEANATAWVTKFAALSEKFAKVEEDGKEAQRKEEYWHRIAEDEQGKREMAERELAYYKQRYEK